MANLLYEHYMNPYTTRDGNVLLYQRKDYVSRNCYARFRFPCEKQYIARCSKTQSFTEAELWATDYFDELRFKQKHGGQLGRKK